MAMAKESGQEMEGSKISSGRVLQQSKWKGEMVLIWLSLSGRASNPRHLHLDQGC